MGLGSGALRLDCKISSMFYDFVGEDWAKPIKLGQILQCLSRFVNRY